MPTYKDEKTGLWYCKIVSTAEIEKGGRLPKEAKEYEIDFLSKSQVSCDMKFRLFAELYPEDCKARVKVTTSPWQGQYVSKAHPAVFR